MIEADAAHAAALAAIHAAAFAPAGRWDAAAMAGLLATPGVFALIDPAGGCVLARVAADEAEILTLAVAPGQRRRGVGCGLLRHARARAAALGAATLFLEVSAGNGAAVALYAAAGFVACGRRLKYYPDGSDALVLRAATCA